MKKIFLIMLAFVASTVSSCNRQEAGKGGDAAQTRRFSMSMDMGHDQAGSRATDAQGVTRYIMEMYKGASASGTPLDRVEHANPYFDVEMTDGDQYTVLFWADYGTPLGTQNVYNTADLKSVIVADGKTPTYEAFAGSKTLTCSSEAEGDYSVRLTHAVARVSFIQKEAVTVGGNTLKVTFDQSFKLNVDKMKATELIENVNDPKPQTHTITGVGPVAANGTLGTIYIIAPTAVSSSTAGMLLTVRPHFNPDANGTQEQELSNIPFSMNFRTNIKASYNDLFAFSADFSCTEDWTQPDINIPFPNAKVGDYYYSDGSYTSEYNGSKTCLGIIFKVNQYDLQQVSVISLDVLGNGRFSSLADISAISSAISETDGKANTNIITSSLEYIANSDNYPPVKWCKSLGNDWYLPTHAECVEVNDKQSILTPAYIAAGRTEFSNLSRTYWTSRYSSSTQVYMMEVSGGFYSDKSQVTAAFTTAAMAQITLR